MGHISTCGDPSRRSLTGWVQTPRRNGDDVTRPSPLAVLLLLVIMCAGSGILAVSRPSSGPAVSAQSDLCSLFAPAELVPLLGVEPGPGEAWGPFGSGCRWAVANGADAKIQKFPAEYFEDYGGSEGYRELDGIGNYAYFAPDAFGVRASALTGDAGYLVLADASADEAALVDLLRQFVQRSPGPPMLEMPSQPVGTPLPDASAAACHLATPEQVAIATGVDVVPGAASCSWEGDIPGGLFAVYLLDVPLVAFSADDGEPVPELGDQAYLDGFDVLYVRSGERGFSVQVLASGAGLPDTLTAQLAIARAVLDHLAGGTGEPTARPTLTLERALDVLAAAGIPVYEDPADTTPIRAPSEPVSPFRQLRHQVENLARDVSAGGGVPADQIDDLIPMPEDAVPFSYIVAGYVATASTPGAELARELMAGQDFDHPAALWFPTIVPTLFVGELTAAASASAGLASPSPGALAMVARSVVDREARLVAFDPCGDLDRFVGRVFSAVREAILKVVPSIPLVRDAIVWALTKGAGLAADAVKGLLRSIPWLQAARDGVQALALAATVVASLRQWTVPLTATPNRAHHSVAGSVSHVTLSARVDDGPGDLFSGPVRRCAELLGIQLPRGGAPGSTVEWRILDGAFHMAPGWEQDRTVGDTRRVRFSFTMTDEPLRSHEGGSLANAKILVQVVVHRQDVTQVANLIRGLISRAIPEAVWSAITRVLGDPIAKLTALTDPGSVVLVVAEFHGEPRPTPTPTPEPRATPVPPREGSGATFCGLYREMLLWWFGPSRSYWGSKTWFFEILTWLEDMRPHAPADLVWAVDVYDNLYRIHATTSGPEAVVLSVEWASQMPQATAALDSYCGIEPGDIPYRDPF
jgi:hypothetical protein